MPVTVIDQFSLNQLELENSLDQLAKAREELASIGTLVKLVRKRAELGQAAVARLAGVKVGRLSDYEKGKAVPTLDDGEALLRWVRDQGILRTIDDQLAEDAVAEVTHP